MKPVHILIFVSMFLLTFINICNAALPPKYAAIRKNASLQEAKQLRAKALDVVQFKTIDAMITSKDSDSCVRIESLKINALVEKSKKGGLQKGDIIEITALQEISICPGPQRYYLREVKKGISSAGYLNCDGKKCTIAANAWSFHGKNEFINESRSTAAQVDCYLKDADDCQSAPFVSLPVDDLSVNNINFETLPGKLSNSIGMDLVFIKPGTITPVECTKLETTGYYIQTTEVTQGQWFDVMGTRPWKGKKYVESNRNNPAVYIAYNDCITFINKLNKKEGINKYRMLTHDEWEYATRGGRTSTYCFGEDKSLLKEYAWFLSSADSDYGLVLDEGLDGNENDSEETVIAEDYAHRVGLKKANQFGLYDMYGNVSELFDFNIKRSSALVSGGSWQQRSCFRGNALMGVDVTEVSHDIGFRIGMEP